MEPQEDPQFYHATFTPHEDSEESVLIEMKGPPTSKLEFKSRHKTSKALGHTQSDESLFLAEEVTLTFKLSEKIQNPKDLS